MRSSRLILVLNVGFCSTAFELAELPHKERGWMRSFCPHIVFATQPEKLLCCLEEHYKLDS